jgi:hypothetical protein
MKGFSEVNEEASTREGKAVEVDNVNRPRVARSLSYSRRRGSPQRRMMIGMTNSCVDLPCHYPKEVAQSVM